MLRSFDEQTGTFAAGGARAIRRTGVAASEVPGRASRWAPYNDAEWDRMRRCCGSVVADAIAERKGALAEASAGQGLRLGGWEPMASRLWLLRRRGPQAAQQVGEYLWLRGSEVSRLGSSIVAGSRLFPTMRLVLAFHILLGMTSGIVPDGLDHLELDHVERTGDSTVLLEYAWAAHQPSGPVSEVVSGV